MSIYPVQYLEEKYLKSACIKIGTYTSHKHSNKAVPRSIIYTTEGLLSRFDVLITNTIKCILKKITFNI